MDSKDVRAMALEKVHSAVKIECENCSRRIISGTASNAADYAVEFGWNVIGDGSKDEPYELVCDSCHHERRS